MLFLTIVFNSAAVELVQINSNTFTLGPGGNNILLDKTTAFGGTKVLVRLCPQRTDIVCNTPFWEYDLSGGGLVYVYWSDFVPKANKIITLTSFMTDQLRNYNACLYNFTINTSAPFTNRLIGSCIDGGMINLPASCTLSLPASIDFGTLSAGSDPVRKTIAGNITCDEDVTVTIRATDQSKSSSRVDLSSDTTVFSILDINGTDGLIGAVLTTSANIVTTFNFGATVSSDRNSSSGQYAGVALVIAEWP
ncbi:MrpH family fimbial adhesin [Serratia fonticola]|uniref:MrpH family fimbial adhesin n=1 Tax=Serratia fonticola TaxID=47917 RepID=UPI001377DEEE|nr:hypothetical protein [Serratia fonticola]NBJ34228.1 hypothetical protein [Serratia fonticola]